MSDPSNLDDDPQLSDERARWNAKHGRALDRPTASPEARFLEALERVPKRGLAIDLACGRGRHSLELARQGFRVLALDISDIALADLASNPGAATIDTRRVDLTADEFTPPEPAKWISCVDYLQRSLWPQLSEWLAPGGHVWLANWTTERSGNHPSDRFCLNPGELAGGLPGLTTVWAPESKGRAGLLARRDRAANR